MIADRSAQLLYVDPPYFETKGEFDWAWKSFEHYLEDVEKWAIECDRILAKNGTLIWWGDALKIAHTQVILDKYFRILNNAVWRKIDAQTNKNKPEDQRRFIPVTERLLVYDRGEIESGHAAIHSDRELFQPLKIYFDEWLEKSGLTLKEATQKIGSSCTHWFGFSTRDKQQFNFPTPEKWAIMESIFPSRKDYVTLKSEYEDLKCQYEKLKDEYEEKRRPFKLPFSIKDVMDYPQESHETKKYKHETKKPPTLTKMLINVTTRKGDLVVIPFSGSGTECEAAAIEKRNFIAFDIKKKYCDMSNKRADIPLRTQLLF